MVWQDPPEIPPISCDAGVRSEGNTTSKQKPFPWPLKHQPYIVDLMAQLGEDEELQTNDLAQFVDQHRAAFALLGERGVEQVGS